jgi:hypothetical protein
MIQRSYLKPNKSLALLLFGRLSQALNHMSQLQHLQQLDILKVARIVIAVDHLKEEMRLLPRP